MNNEENLQQNSDDKNSVIASTKKVSNSQSQISKNLEHSLGKEHQVEFKTKEKKASLERNSFLQWLIDSPIRLLSFSFLFLILSGALLLMLPFASQSGQWTDFYTTLFTSTSAVCVTGLVLVDTGTYWSRFGQLVIIMLIQFGGLSIITVAAAFFSLTKKKMNHKYMRTVQEATGNDNAAEVYSFVKGLILVTLAFEFIGGCILSWRFSYIMPFKQALFSGFFQAVSAFCNAGFDLLGPVYGEYSSLVYLNSDIFITMTTALLLTFGGIGFIVWLDLFRKKKGQRLSFHSRLVFGITASILAIGTIVFLILEWGNTGELAMGELPIWQRPFAAFFQVATLRTAGFNTISQSNLSQASKLISCIVMFIGAAPLSTGGGMKVTTFAIVGASTVSNLQGKEYVSLFGHKVPKSMFTRSFVIITMGTIVAFIAYLFLLISEAAALKAGKYDSIDLLFETVSALGTVGVTSVQTENISLLGRIPLILAMFIGRVGPFSFALLLSMKSHQQTNAILPEAETFVG